MPERDVLSALLNRINWESENPIIGGMPLLSTRDAADRILESLWLAAHDREVAARTLDAASDDYYGDTHIPGLSAMTWLRERAAALRSGTEGSGQ